MKPRLVLHIGTHKTGTTTIQRALERGRATLAAQKVLYPPTAREPWPELPKHCSVFAAAASGDPERIERERRWLMQAIEAAEPEVIVLSEEGLSEPIPRLVEFFAPFAQGFEIEVICGLRRPDLFVESLYNQFVRESARREGRPILAFARAPALRERLDYHAMLSAWRALPARVTALDFEREARDGGWLAAFLRAARLPEIAPDDEAANRSPDMRLALLCARLNRQRVDYALGPLLQAARALEATRRFPPRRHLLGGEERRRLLQEMAPSLDWLSADFGVRFDDTLPAGEAAQAAEDLDPAYLAELLAAVTRR